MDERVGCWREERVKKMDVRLDGEGQPVGCIICFHFIKQFFPLSLSISLCIFFSKLLKKLKNKVSFSSSVVVLCPLELFFSVLA